MHVLLLEDSGMWIQYNAGVLMRDKAYMFVAWVAKKDKDKEKDATSERTDDDVVLVFPQTMPGASLDHRTAVAFARRFSIINGTHDEPNCFGAICNGDYERISSWLSPVYQRKTPEALRHPIRIALGLGDTLY